MCIVGFADLYACCMTTFKAFLYFFQSVSALVPRASNKLGE